MKRYLALQKIVETGSFAKAAEIMGYSQPALTSMITSLEDELSIKLLNRKRTGSSLTDEGKELYPYIERTIFQYHATIEKAKDINNLKTGIIRMATVTSVSVNWLPEVIQEFHEQYPDVEFIMHQGDYNMIEEWIKIGAVDFGFVSPEFVKGIEIEPLKTGGFSAILPKDHPLAELDVVPLKELASNPFIMLEMGHHSECEAAFREHDIRPNVRYTIHDDYAIMAMVERGMGVSLLANLVIGKIAGSFDVVTKPVDPPVYRTLGIGYKDKLDLPMASKKFIKALKSHLDELP